MADEYVLVRLADNIPDEAVLVYDAQTDTIKDSGITAKQGELQATAGTIKVGLQEMSSEGEQVVWRNRESNVAYAPPWHIIDEVSPGGSVDRFYGDLQDIVRYDIKAGVVEDPSFLIRVAFNEIITRVTVDAVEAHPNAIYEIIGPDGEPIWEQHMILSVGQIEYLLDIPTAIRAGDYTARIRDYDTGVPVRLQGDPQTGAPYYAVKVRPFFEKPLATIEYVEGVKGTGFNVVVRSQTPDITSGTLTDDISNYLVLNYTTAPGPDDEPYSLAAPRGVNGSTLMIENTGTQPVALTVASPVTIGGAALYSILPDHMVVLSYTEGTEEWLVAFDKVLDGASGTFLDLADTPSTYDEPKDLVRVNATSTGLEFVTPTLTLNNDVRISNPQSGDILYYTGDHWQNEIPIPDFNVVGFTANGGVGQLNSFVSNYLYVDNEQEVSITTPEEYSEHFLLIENANTQLTKDVVVEPLTGTTINNQTDPLRVPPRTRAMLRFFPDNWSLIYMIPLDPSIPEVTPRNYIEVISLTNTDQIGGVSADVSTYLYSVAETAKDITLPRVDSSNLTPFFLVENRGENPSAEITLNAPSGASIENSTFSVIPPQTEAMYLYGNGDWALVYQRDLNPNPQIKVYSDSSTLEGVATGFIFPGATITQEQDGRVQVKHEALNVKFYQSESDSNPVVASDTVVFPNSSIFVGSDGKAVVDTATAAVDDKGNSVGDVIDFSFKHCTVEQQDIPGRSGRTVVVTPDVNPTNAEVQHGAALLAYIGNRQQINTRYPNPPALQESNVYFDDIAWVNSDLVDYNPVSHSYVLRPRNDEPTVYFVSATLSFKSDEVSDYGYIRLYANDDSAQLGEYPVVTTNTGILANQIYYRDTERLGSVTVEGFVRVTEEKEISFHVVDSLTKDVLYLEDRDVLPSAVLIQEMRQGFRTSPAMQQYCTDLQRDIRVSHIDLSKPSSIDWITRFNNPLRIVPAGTQGSLHAGEVLHAINKLNLKIENNEILFQSFDGTTPLDFCFGSVLSNEQTIGLRGKQVQMDISSKISTVGVLTQVLMVVWKGEADEWTPDVYTGRDINTKDPIFAPNWSLGGEYVGNNDDTPDYKLHTANFTVPLDAVNVGFVFLIKNTLNDAYGDIYINRLDTSTNPPLSTDVFHDPLFHGNNIKYSDDESMVFSLNSHGYASLVYNLGVDQVPIPLGYVTQGGAPVIIDRTENVNQNVQFKDAYGALSFPEEALVTLNTTLQVYNSTPTTNTVDFQWYVKHGKDGVEEPIGESLSIFPNIVPDTTVGATIKMKPLTYGVKAGDLLYIKGWSNIDGGGYIESAPRLGNDKPMIVVEMDYKRIQPIPDEILPKGDALRVFFKTLDDQPAGQVINQVNQAATVVFTEVDKVSERVTVDPATGVFTFLDTTPAIATAAFNVIRNVDASPQGATYHWGVFVETSVDGGATWVPVPQSTVVETFLPSAGRQVRPLTFTFPIVPTVAGTKVRFEFFANNEAMTIVALPANYYGANEPASAGALFAVYSVK